MDSLETEFLDRSTYSTFFEDAILVYILKKEQNFIEIEQDVWFTVLSAILFLLDSRIRGSWKICRRNWKRKGSWSWEEETEKNWDIFKVKPSWGQSPPVAAQSNSYYVTACSADKLFHLFYKHFVKKELLNNEHHTLLKLKRITQSACECVPAHVFEFPHVWCSSSQRVYEFSSERMCLCGVCMAVMHSNH